MMNNDIQHPMCCWELMHPVEGCEEYEAEGIVYTTKYYFCFRCHGCQTIDSQHKLMISSISGREM
jgi:hypothetical protein